MALSMSSPVAPVPCPVQAPGAKSRLPPLRADMASLAVPLPRFTSEAGEALFSLALGAAFLVFRDEIVEAMTSRRGSSARRRAVVKWECLVVGWGSVAWGAAGLIAWLAHLSSLVPLLETSV